MEIKQILDKKLKGNDKYLIKNILSYLYKGCCEKCNCYVLDKQELILVYCGDNCLDIQKYYCVNCVNTHCNWCKYCMTNHNGENMKYSAGYYPMCYYCSKNNIYKWEEIKY